MSEGLRFVHDAGFLEAFSNGTHTVLGKRLAPFCLWHQLNLEKAQAKVLTGEALTPLDLWIAVRICTTPWTPQFPAPDLRPPGLYRFIFTVGRYKFAREVAEFEAYLLDYVSGPKFWPNQHESHEGDGDRDIDDNLELALHLVKDGGFSWRDAWTMPLGVARWNSAGLAKLAGHKVDIWTPQHEALFEQHKKKREAEIDAHGREIAEKEGIPFEQARQKANDQYWKTVNDRMAHATKPQHS